MPPSEAEDICKIIKGMIDKLPGLKCQICGLNGHTNSSCWLNGQIYNLCRSAGREAMEANFLWREALKTHRSMRDEAIKLECAMIRKEAMTKTRLASGAYRINKKNSKLKSRTAFLAKALDKDLAEERKKFRAATD